MQTAKDDIRTVESWGYSRSEALEFVTRRAVAEARRIAEEAHAPADREILEQQLTYLAELRAICLASMSRSRSASHT